MATAVGNKLHETEDVTDLAIGVQSTTSVGHNELDETWKEAGVEADETQEATELGQLSETAGRDARTPTQDHINDEAASRTNTSVNQSPKGLWQNIRSFWSRQIAITAPHEACRDHWANERTYLGYLRTSVAFAIQGILIAQLFRLQHSQKPNVSLGFYIIGIPLAAMFLAFAAAITLIGGYRFWRHQNAMARGKAQVGGWEVYTVGLLGLATTTAVFVLTLAINIDKEILNPGVSRHL